MAERATGAKATDDGLQITRYEALALLYLQKQNLEGCTPEEIVGRFIEAHEKVVREFERQKEIRKQHLNPLPV